MSPVQPHLTISETQSIVALPGDENNGGPKNAKRRIVIRVNEKPQYVVEESAPAKL